MKFKTILFCMMLVATAAVAQETEQQPPPGTDQTAGEQEDNQAPPAIEDLAGKVDASGEALTELKNIVDALNKLKISGYIQAQYVNDERSQDSLTSPTATRNFDQFSIRRARVKFVYTASPIARFTFQPEVTTSGTSLKDAFIELTEQKTLWKNTLTAGQFNWPFGFEIAYSSSDRELPERTRVIRTLFPGERDRGVMVSGAAPSGVVNYKIAIVNGTGTGQSFDFNSDKDIVGRLGASFGPLDIGVSGYEGTDLVATTQVPAGVEFDKSRQGVDFQLLVPFINGMALRGEYIQGEERGLDVDGWYAYLLQNFGTRHQVALRVDEYDPNTDRGDNATLTLGGSYIFHFDAHAKVMLAYERPELELNDVDDNVSTIRFQYKF
jgi:hypothetical protein